MVHSNFNYSTSFCVWHQTIYPTWWWQNFKLRFHSLFTLFVAHLNWKTNEIIPDYSELLCNSALIDIGTNSSWKPFLNKEQKRLRWLAVATRTNGRWSGSLNSEKNRRWYFLFFIIIHIFFYFFFLLLSGDAFFYQDPQRLQFTKYNQWNSIILGCQQPSNKSEFEFKTQLFSS